MLKLKILIREEKIQEGLSTFLDISKIIKTPTETLEDDQRV